MGGELPPVRLLAEEAAPLAAAVVLVCVLEAATTQIDNVLALGPVGTGSRARRTRNK
jgi:hypothetical protein